MLMRERVLLIELFNIEGHHSIPCIPDTIVDLSIVLLA